ncbi:MAG: class I SAM-dependent methyltransferase [Candidatus Omnitrophica bacterium]|nr:class I SAM-dependent methyltransferase [Candidatus Omnitrophota bacterium]
MADLRKDFDERAEVYDKWIACLCPFYDEAMNALLHVLPKQVIFILELGCGTGNLSVRLLQKYSKANLTVVDVSPKMLAATRKKLEGFTQQISYREKNFTSFHSEYQYDTIVSSLAIHHLEPKEKEQLFTSVLKMLKPGGCFYLMDCVKGQSRELDMLYHEKWLEHMRAHTVPNKEISEALRRREEHDRCDSLPFQLGILKKAGFVDCDVVFKIYGIAVFGGQKY